MARRVSRGRVGRPQTRKFVWAREQMDQIVAAQDAAFINLLTDFETEYGADLVGATVMRIRGQLRFIPSGVINGTIVAGALVGSERTYAALTTAAARSAAGPVTDRHADWMLYQPIDFQGSGSIVFDFDVKSARRMEELGEQLLLAVENPTVGVTVTVRGILSVGLKLP